jgi:uncharacterized peroxidase-related enzyme
MRVDGPRVGPGARDTRFPMARIPVPADTPGIRGLFAFRPEVGAVLGLLADTLLSGTESFSAGERELVAAYVSSLNECTFCHASHAAIAACHLGDEEVVAAVVDNLDAAPISSKARALLRLAAKVQQGGRAVQDGDVAQARAEGATDGDIHDTVLIAAAFCMFNRYVDGLQASTPTDSSFYRERGRAVAAHGYSTPFPMPAAAPASRT